ncbi:hypothetical protein ENBRE01_2512 [Enteropsectra breve]|nr:hypothetical protein ENBRE01_2512 [Enteropsectra breve]
MLSDEDPITISRFRRHCRPQYRGYRGKTREEVSQCLEKHWMGLGDNERNRFRGITVVYQARAEEYRNKENVNEVLLLPTPVKTRRKINIEDIDDLWRTSGPSEFIEAAKEAQDESEENIEDTKKDFEGAIETPIEEDKQTNTINERKETETENEIDTNIVNNEHSNKFSIKLKDCYDNKNLLQNSSEHLYGMPVIMNKMIREFVIKPHDKNENSCRERGLIDYNDKQGNIRILSIKNDIAVLKRIRIDERRFSDFCTDEFKRELLSLKNETDIPFDGEANDIFHEFYKERDEIFENILQQQIILELMKNDAYINKSDAKLIYMALRPLLSTADYEYYYRKYYYRT